MQVASDRLLASGVVNHCINAGGDIRVLGHSGDGESATYLRSVTVTGRNLAIADAYATAAMAMGERGPAWLTGLVGYESAVVTESGEAFRSDGLPAVD